MSWSIFVNNRRSLKMSRPLKIKVQRTHSSTLLAYHTTSISRKDRTTVPTLGMSSTLMVPISTTGAITEVFQERKGTKITMSSEKPGSAMKVRSPGNQSRCSFIRTTCMSDTKVIKISHLSSSTRILCSRLKVKSLSHAQVSQIW